MARSQYIYLVFGEPGGSTPTPLGAFTVEHEMYTWLWKQFRAGCVGAPEWRIFRIRDRGTWFAEPERMDNPLPRGDLE